MSPTFTPPRTNADEILDDPGVAAELMTRSMRDVARANVLFGGRRAAMAELLPALAAVSSRADLLDVGTGLGDIPAEAKRVARAMGLQVRTIGVDRSFPLVALQRGCADSLVQADAFALPFRDKSIDVVMVSQVLHHFPPASAVLLVQELDRVAKQRVVISDLRRSLIAAAGLWLGSFPLGFHPVSRHDGVVSVMRGFLPSELASIVEAATGKRPVIRRRLGFRLTTSWDPRS